VEPQRVIEAGHLHMALAKWQAVRHVLVPSNS
jgi:hypothetical protein